MPIRTQMEERAWRLMRRTGPGVVLMAAVALGIGAAWQWVALALAAYFPSLLLLARGELRAEQLQADDHRRYYGTLELTDTEVIYTWNGERQAMAWDDIGAVLYCEAEDLFYGRDEWLLRDTPCSQVIYVPDCLKDVPSLLAWCARKLSGFDPLARDKALAAAPPWREREAMTIECWLRERPSNPE